MGKEEFLKERAKDFYKLAKRNLHEGFYNVSAFEIEQACQLYLKYLLFKKVGDYPRVHFLSTLLEELYKATEDERIKVFLEKHNLEIQSLESAYLSSRYLGKEYNRLEAGSLVNFADSLIKFLEEITGEKFF